MRIASSRFSFLVAISICLLPMAFVSNVLAQSGFERFVRELNASESLQIQRDILQIEEQRLRIEQERYFREQQQDIERVQGHIANLISNLREKQLTLLRLRQESLEKLGKLLSMVNGHFSSLQTMSERTEKNILRDRTKSKMTHPRADIRTHFTEAFQRPYEQRRKDIEYIVERYARGIAEIEASLAVFPAVVPDDFAAASLAHEKEYLSRVVKIGRMWQVAYLAEYKSYLLSQEEFDTMVRMVRKDNPNYLPRLERELTEGTRELVQGISSLADGDAKSHAEWMSLAKR